ncbi:MAG: hydrogenase maturation protease [Thermoproteales archaeon]|nr:hydrogenase maturation protease [Thermoproteales archaeon]
MKIEEHIKELVRSKKTLFVCMGNLLRGDDGIGSYICHKILEIKQCDNILIVGSYLENALGKIIEKRPKNIIFIDAVHTDSEEGTIIFKKINNDDFAKNYPLTTHSIPFPLLLKFIKNELRDVEFYLLGICASHTSIGNSICSKVKESGETLFRFLSKEIVC